MTCLLPVSHLLLRNHCFCRMVWIWKLAWSTPNFDRWMFRTVSHQICCVTKHGKTADWYHLRDLDDCQIHCRLCALLCFLLAYTIAEKVLYMQLFYLSFGWHRENLNTHKATTMAAMSQGLFEGKFNDKTWMTLSDSCIHTTVLNSRKLYGNCFCNLD